MSARKGGLLGAAFIGVLALTGCATVGSDYSTEETPATLDRIEQELTVAAASLKPASPERVRDSLLPSLDVALPEAAVEAAEARFDLVVNNAPAAQVFMALVANSPYSIMVAPDLGGQISVSLKDVTVKEALDSIRDNYGYDYTIRGKRIQVQSNALQMRMFQVNYLAGKRQGSSELRVSASSISQLAGNTSGSASGGSTAPQSTAGKSGQDTSRVSMTTEADFWGDLKTALHAIVGEGEGRTVILNALSGVILVKAGPAEIRAVENYLRKTQLIIERQVMLEAKIIDVALNDEFQSGINWAAFGSSGRTNSGGGIAAPGTVLGTAGAVSNNSVILSPGAAGSLVTSATGNGFIGLSLQTDNFSSLISFLQTQGNAQVLSSPRIATLNNQKAVLKVGADEFYVTGVSTNTTTTTTGSTTSPDITLQPFFSGISLDVTPQIDEFDNIILHVHPAVSVVSEKQKQIDLGALGNFILPLATSTINETDSIVRVQDGRIVAIGGLMKQEESKGRTQLPGLGDVPFVGGLFGQRSNSFRKRELVILIKPTIIQGVGQWGGDVQETQRRVREFGQNQGQRSRSANQATSQ